MAVDHGAMQLKLGSTGQLELRGWIAGQRRLGVAGQLRLELGLVTGDWKARLGLEAGNYRLWLRLGAGNLGRKVKVFQPLKIEKN